MTAAPNTWGSPNPVADANNESWMGSAAITPGTPYALGRGIGFVCTAAGNITVTLSDGSTMTFPVVASASLQILPFATTGVALGSGTTGTFWVLN